MDLRSELQQLYKEAQENELAEDAKRRQLTKDYLDSDKFEEFIQKELNDLEGYLKDVARTKNEYVDWAYSNKDFLNMILLHDKNYKKTLIKNDAFHYFYRKVLERFEPIIFQHYIQHLSDEELVITIHFNWSKPKS